MAEYTMINSQGKECGTKILTDAMADRLTGSGWRIVPVASTVTAKVITFGRK